MTSPFVLPAMIDDRKVAFATAPGEAAGEIFAVIVELITIPDILNAPAKVVAVLPEIVELLTVPLDAEMPPNRVAVFPLTVLAVIVKIVHLIPPPPKPPLVPVAVLPERVLRSTMTGFALVPLPQIPPPCAALFPWIVLSEIVKIPPMNPPPPPLVPVAVLSEIVHRFTMLRDWLLVGTLTPPPDKAELPLIVQSDSDT